MGKPFLYDDSGDGANSGDGDGGDNVDDDGSDDGGGDEDDGCGERWEIKDVFLLDPSSTDSWCSLCAVGARERGA